jgi:GDP-L-fucose synthase
MKKIVLVTGGTGLVGNAIKNVSHSFKYINYEFLFISSKDYDLTIFDKTSEMFQKYQPYYVIHLAACVGGLYKNMNNKVEMLEKNLMINYNVVKCSHIFNVEKLICCLSTCIFPDNVTYPIDESMLHNGPPHHSNDAYAYAKRMLEIQCKAYRENYGSNFICVTPTNIYGPFDNFDLENAHVLPALIHKCYLAKKHNIDFRIRGTGTPLRQFIYSEDLAKLILNIMENHNDDNLILSVPENDEISIKDIAFIIAKCFNYENYLIFETNFSDGQYKKTVSSKKLLNRIPDFQFTMINNGIEKTVKWFIENYENQNIKK